MLYEGNNGYNAAIFQVTVDTKTCKVTVNHAWAAQDCGPVVNPDAVDALDAGRLVTDDRGHGPHLVAETLSRRGTELIGAVRHEAALTVEDVKQRVRTVLRWQLFDKWWSDQLRRNRSTQYFSYPGYDFDRLRREAPGQYESYVDLEVGEWTHLRIEVAGAVGYVAPHRRKHEVFAQEWAALRFMAVDPAHRRQGAARRDRVPTCRRGLRRTSAPSSHGSPPSAGPVPRPPSR